MNSLLHYFMLSASRAGERAINYANVHSHRLPPNESNGSFWPKYFFANGILNEKKQSKQ